MKLFSDIGSYLNLYEQALMCRGGHNLHRLVEIGLTYLPKLGPPCPHRSPISYIPDYTKKLKKRLMRPQKNLTSKVFFDASFTSDHKNNTYVIDSFAVQIHMHTFADLILTEIPRQQHFNKMMSNIIQLSLLFLIYSRFVNFEINFFSVSHQLT